MTATVIVARSQWPVLTIAIVGVLTVVAACALLAPIDVMLLVAVWIVPVAAAAGIDAASGRLPDSVVLPGFLVVLTVACVIGKQLPAVGGALMLATPMLVVHLARPSGFGFGDVKYGLLLGVGIGTVAISLVPIAFLLAAVVHAVGACVLRCTDRLVPFGPALATASGIVITLGVWRLR